MSNSLKSAPHSKAQFFCQRTRRSSLRRSVKNGLVRSCCLGEGLWGSLSTTKLLDKGKCWEVHSLPKHIVSKFIRDYFCPTLFRCFRRDANTMSVSRSGILISILSTHIFVLLCKHVCAHICACTFFLWLQLQQPKTFYTTCKITFNSRTAILRNSYILCPNLDIQHG